MSPSPTSASLPKPRRRWLTLLLSLIIFIGGVVVGTGGTIAVAVHRIQYAIHHPEEAPRRITDRLRSKLSLDAQQADAVYAVVARRQANLQAIRREVQPRVEAELDGAVSEVEGVLRPEQAAKWRQMVRQIREQWLPSAAP